jgi:hypothetical protein
MQGVASFFGAKATGVKLDLPVAVEAAPPATQVQVTGLLSLSKVLQEATDAMVAQKFMDTIITSEALALDAAIMGTIKKEIEESF